MSTNGQGKIHYRFLIEHIQHCPLSLFLCPEADGDNIFLGTGGNRLDEIQGEVRADGGSDGDRLVAQDENTPRRTCRRTPTTLTRSGTARISYRNIEHLRLAAGSFGDMITVEGTDTAVTIINGRDGDGNFRVSPTALNLTTIGGDLQLDGGNGWDIVHLHDDLFEDEYTLYDDHTTIAGLGLSIGHSAVEELFLYTSPFSIVSDLTAALLWHRVS